MIPFSFLRNMTMFWKINFDPQGPGVGVCGQNNLMKTQSCRNYRQT